MLIKNLYGMQLKYNPDTGEFFKFCVQPNRYWKSPGWNLITGQNYAGDMHITSPSGKKHLLRNLAFEMNGAILTEDTLTFHINRNKRDNRWLNLGRVFKNA